MIFLTEAHAGRIFARVLTNTIFMCYYKKVPDPINRDRRNIYSPIFAYVIGLL